MTAESTALPMAIPGTESPSSAFASTNPPCDKITDEVEVCGRKWNIYMSVSIASAFACLVHKHGGPFGAAIVKDGIILSASHNEVILQQDPTCHAEMTAIRAACATLKTWDLSGCDLYTTCEPCPMCLGACQWSKVTNMYFGTNRQTAAKYGFDDDVFYRQLMQPSANGIQMPEFEDLIISVCYTSSDPRYRLMLRRGQYLLWKSYFNLFYRTNTSTSKPLKRVATNKKLNSKAESHDSTTNGEEGIPCSNICSQKPTTQGHSDGDINCLSGNENVKSAELKNDEVDVVDRQASDDKQSTVKLDGHFMEKAIDASLEGFRFNTGAASCKAPYGTVIVHKNKVIASAYNTVLLTNDPTATSEVNAIRKACKVLKNFDLNECELYTTTEPDLMSMCAILWARIPVVAFGVTLQKESSLGYKDAETYFRQLKSYNEKYGSLVDQSDDNTQTHGTSPSPNSTIVHPSGEGTDHVSFGVRSGIMKQECTEVFRFGGWIHY